MFSTDTQHNREAMKKSPRWPKNREDCLKTDASFQGAGGMNFFLSFRKNDKKVFTKKKKEALSGKSVKAAKPRCVHCYMVEFQAAERSTTDAGWE